MKENTERNKSDIDFLLQTILDNPPNIDLGGFVILDNGLITSVSYKVLHCSAGNFPIKCINLWFVFVLQLMSTMVTYLIVLLQFKV